uniref:Uncharacterized protein n=1 Tax=Strigamia maritima TaxID=126957 RepID=T1JMQ8_STRMM
MPKDFLEMNYVVRVGEDFKIPPMHESTMRVRLPVNITEQLYCEPLSNTMDRFGLMCCKTLTNFVKGTALIRVANPSKKLIIIRKHSAIAIAYYIVETKKEYSEYGIISSRRTKSYEERNTMLEIMYYHVKNVQKLPIKRSKGTSRTVMYSVRGSQSTP